jgi:hypothetical protein
MFNKDKVLTESFLINYITGRRYFIIIYGHLIVELKSINRKVREACDLCTELCIYIKIPDLHPAILPMVTQAGSVQP